MKKKNSYLVKFAVVAAMVGFFSPSVSVKTDVQAGNDSYSLAPIALNISILNTAEARGGHGGGGARGGGARRGGGNVRRSGGAQRNRSNTRNRSRNTNRNKNVNRNRNVNRNVNVNRNNRYYGGGYRGGYGYRGGNGYRGGYGGGYGYYRGAPILAFGAGMAIGSIIAASTMPSSCTTIVTSGVSYRQCDGLYYQPFYQGDTVVYKSVASPYY